MNNPAFISLIAMRRTSIDFRDSDALTRRRAERGFTLIELLVTLSIAVILMTIAGPNFLSFIQNGRMASNANELTLALTYAKSEAVKRNTNVKVMKVADAVTACSGGGAGWSKGWTVFVDADDDNVVDAGETLRVWSELKNTTLCFNAGTTVEFRNSGTTANIGTFRLCDSRGASEARGMIVSLQGRIRRATDSNADGTEEDGSGTNLVCP